jgi:integrase
MKLTDAGVAGLELPAGKSEHFVWDDALPAFGVRIRAGAKRYYVQYRVGRQQRRESLGDVRKIKLEAARAIARKRFAQVELGADPAADRAKAKAEAVAVKQTVGATVDRYLVVKAKVLRATTYAAAARYLTSHWKALHAMPIATVKRADVAAILQEISANNGRVAAARARANLSALFGWAIREGLCDANVVLATNNPEEGIARRDRILDDAELRAVWSACLDDPFGRIVRLLVLTGCRREEIGGLRWNELNFETGVMSIPGARTKGKKALTLTLPPAALESLSSVPRRDGQAHVFGKAGKAGFNAWSYSTIALNNRIAAAAGKPLAPWTLHDLRRTFRSGLSRIGVAPHVAERCVGHVQQGVAAIYDRYAYEAEIRTALARWSEHVAGIVEERPSKVVPMRA